MLRPTTATNKDTFSEKDSFPPILQQRNPFRSTEHATHPNCGELQPFWGKFNLIVFFFLYFLYLFPFLFLNYESPPIPWMSPPFPPWEPLNHYL